MLTFELVGKEAPVEQSFLTSSEETLTAQAWGIPYQTSPTTTAAHSGGVYYALT